MSSEQHNFTKIWKRKWFINSLLQGRGRQSSAFLPVKNRGICRDRKALEVSKFIRVWFVAGSSSQEQVPLFPPQVKILGLLLQHSPVPAPLPLLPGGRTPTAAPSQGSQQAARGAFPLAVPSLLAGAALSPSPAPICWRTSGGQLQLCGEGGRGLGMWNLAEQVGSKGCLGSDAETLALSSPHCGWGSQIVFQMRECLPQRLLKVCTTSPVFTTAKKPEPYSQKGFNSEPSTMCFFCACRGETGKKSQLWNSTWWSCLENSCRAGSQLSSSSGSGEPTNPPARSMRAAEAQPLPDPLPQRGAAPPPSQTLLFLFSLALTTQCPLGRPQTRLLSLGQRYPHALLSSPVYCPPNLGIKPGYNGPHCCSLVSQDPSSTAGLRGKGMAATRTKSWLLLDLLRKAKCWFHSDPWMEWVLVFLSASPSPSFPVCLPNGKAHFS